MKLCLLMMVTAGESPYLRLHLPVYVDQFDGAVVLLQRGQDFEAEAQALQATVKPYDRLEWLVRDFHNDWSEFLNIGIEYAEYRKYDAIMRLDPDEVLFAADISKIRTALERADILMFPRRNFFGDRLHYATDHWPDYQARAFKLNKGTRYVGQHHEGPHCAGPLLTLDDVVIYHYGWVGKQRIRERALHYMNVAREAGGLPPLTEYPADQPDPVWPTAPFDGPQPIDPRVVGMYAPFNE
jgi:hypothetical protein